MRCGRILVEGEAEEVAAAAPPPRTCRLPRRQQSRSNKKDAKVKGSNPYATRGLDKFASLNEELAAKRVHVARKTGAPEDLVRFCYSSKGWVPVVVKVGKSASGDPRVSILRPVRRRKDIASEENDNESAKNKDGCLEIEKGCHMEIEKGCQNPNPDTVSVQPVNPLCGYLKNATFGVLTESAMAVRKSVLPSVAMAVVMVVGALQKRWQGGVMCMKKFVETGMSYFSNLILYWKNKMVEKEPEKMVKKEPQKMVENKNLNVPENGVRTSEIKKRPAKSLSICSSPLSGPLRVKNDIHLSSPKQEAAKNKKEYARIVSLDRQPRKPIRSDFHKSESFNRSFNKRRLQKVGVGSSVGATVMIVVLICLVFYGRLCAILVTSAWWYLLPKFRTEGSKSESGDFSKMDLKERELRRKKVIMDGLLDRSHNHHNNNNNNNIWSR